MVITGRAHCIHICIYSVYNYGSLRKGAQTEEGLGPKRGINLLTFLTSEVVHPRFFLTFYIFVYILYTLHNEESAFL